MTKKQRQRRKERRQQSVRRVQEAARQEQARRRERRRLRPVKERFYAPPDRSWLVLEALPLRASKCADDLRRIGLPVFEAREQVKLEAENGKPRLARVPVLRRVLFVGILGLPDLVKIERCGWVSRVLCSAADGEFAWLDRDRFRDAWIEAETFDGARMPLIGRAAMQEFADHLIGYKKDGEVKPGVFEILFRIGAEVSITEGALTSFRGVVEGFDADEGRYTVGVDVFGRRTLVDFEARQLVEA